MKAWMGISASVIGLMGCGDHGAPTAPATPPEAAVVAASTAPEHTAGYSAERNAYFGDLHIHTKNSFDAYIFNVRSSPDDAYRFGKGEAIRHPAGFEMKLGGPPLDFMAVTDHGEYLGVLRAMNTPGNALADLDMAKDMFSKEPEKITGAFQRVGATVRSGKAIEEMNDAATMHAVWQETVDAAERNYQPGSFTTFSAYEFTAISQASAADDSIGGGNLHRNVFFRGKAPDRIFTTLDSTNPEDLWDWLDSQRAAGIEALAIPHNSNVSNGQMFSFARYDGSPMDADYAEQRMRNEPLVEITQVKGTSETHPELSPNDEWADFEIYEDLLGTQIRSRVSGGYVREAWGRGLVMQDQGAFNPFRLGVVAASDTHVAGGAFDESDYWSKAGIIDGLPQQRGSVPPNGAKTWDGVKMDGNAEHWFSRWSASGLAAVWAEENTRESIFEAMRRKETFGTSGTRIKLRFFGGYGYDESLLNDTNIVSKAYAGGVPMGGELAGDERQPVFVAWAMRDPRGAPLQRLQIVKVWSEDGSQHEAIHDAACSQGMSPDPLTHRCPDNGASVNLADCSISQDKGDTELRALWRDPQFNASQRALYYVRVLENPSCRWSTWDALKAGVERNPALPPTIQERAWSSPIWYQPKAG